MTNRSLPPDVDDLEAAIRHALHTRADAYEITGARLDFENHGPEASAPRVPRRWQTRSAIAGAALIAAAVVLVVASVWFLSGGPDKHDTPAQVPSTTAPTTTEPSPVPGAVNVPLRKVDTPAFMLRSATGQTLSNSAVTSYLAGNGPLVAVSNATDASGAPSQCLSVETSYNSADPSGSQATGRVSLTSSTCDPPGAVMQVFHYPHSDSPADPTILYAWTQVPADTAYVTLQSGNLLLWQRPVGGVVVFPVSNDPIDATLHAVRADAADAGSATIAKTYNGAQSLPGQLPQHRVSDPRYPMCSALVGDDGLVGIFDHGTGGELKISVAVYCEGLFGPISGELPYTEAELHAVGVTETRQFTNGIFTPIYVEYETTTHDGIPAGTTRADKPVPVDEVKRRIEQARAGN